MERRSLLCAAAAASLYGAMRAEAAAGSSGCPENPITAMSRFPTRFKSVKIDGLTIAYREAGPADAPTLVLLHGFPSSSRMFAPLFPLLAGTIRLVAPDLPGFGHSDAPPPGDYAYGFEQFGITLGHFLDLVAPGRVSLYLQDYGGYAGLEFASARPERVSGLIVQNSIIDRTGLREAGWKPREAYWKDPASNLALVEQTFFSPRATEGRHRGSSPNADRYDPDLWTDELAFLARPGQKEIQLAIYDAYRRVPSLYPKWQAFLAEHRPPTLVAWGRYDPSFTQEGAEIYRRVNPATELHFVDGGHFALDEAAGEIAALIRDFMLKLHG
jgi:pimeloyl-ACP methyl ester carboxylesterase